MPTKVRLVVNVEGFNAYRNSADVTALCEEYGTTLGERFENGVRSFAAQHDLGAPDRPDVTVETTHGASRVRVKVRANSFRARLAEARERLLVQALGGSSGGGGGGSHSSSDSSPVGDGKVSYTTRDGRTIRVTRAQALAYGGVTRGLGS